MNATGATWVGNRLGWTPLWRDRPRNVVTVGLPPQLSEAISSDPGMAGHTVLTVHTVEGALGLLAQREMDAVVASVDLSNTSLATLVRQIRGSPVSRNALVIAIADSGTEEQEAREAAVNQVLRSSWLCYSTARDIGLCLEVAHAVRKATKTVRPTVGAGSLVEDLDCGLSHR